MSNDLLMVKDSEPTAFERPAGSRYLKDDTVLISVSIGNGFGFGKAWGCDLSYDYVKINAEYTT
jgi:glutamate N-acetyltransferase/amino-acid N-acetyltransferase